MIQISKDISKAVALLNQNQLVAIPTETVYGLAGNIYNEEAIKSIFKIKNRPFFNPLIVHINSINQLKELAKDIPEKAHLLAKAFWPGSLTLVLKKQDIIPFYISVLNPEMGASFLRDTLDQDIEGLVFRFYDPKNKSEDSVFLAKLVDPVFQSKSKENKKKDDKKDKKDDKKDDKDKGKDKKDDKGDEKKDDEKQNPKDKENQQPRPNQLSPEQMKQLLEAMNNEENKTQQKLNEQKSKGIKIKQEKDW